MSHVLKITKQNEGRIIIEVNGHEIDIILEEDSVTVDIDCGKQTAYLEF